MKKIFALLLLASVFHVAYAQTAASIYFQVKDKGLNPPGPVLLIPGAEWRDQAFINFLDINLTGTTYVSNGTTLIATFTTPSPHGLTVGSGVQFSDAIVGSTSYTNTICGIDSVPSSTTFTINVGAVQSCSDRGQAFHTAGSGTFASGHLLKRAAPGISYQGTWSITDHGTTTGKYFLRSGNDRSVIGAGTPCTPDLHTSTCYQQNPSLVTQIQEVYIEVDPSITPTCSQTGSLETGHTPQILTSNVLFTLTFTYGSVSASREYAVCEVGAGSGFAAIPQIYGGYEQNYINEDIPIMANEFANADQYTIWSVVDVDGGGSNATIETLPAPVGDGFLKNGGALPVAVLHTGTVGHTGIEVKACSDAAPTNCVYSRHWLSNNAKPLANTDNVFQTPCEPDPVMAAAGGRVFDVGPGQTYTDGYNLPVNAMLWGDTVIFHNEGSTVGSPIQVASMMNFKTPTNWAAHISDKHVPALHICGKPNPTSGELPIIQAINATAPSSCSIYTCIHFQISLSVNSGAIANSNDVYTSSMNPFHNVGIAGLHFQNATAPNKYYDPGQLPPSGTQSNWSGFGGVAIRIIGVQGWTAKGNFFDAAEYGIMSNCNTFAHGWQGNCSQLGNTFGNRFRAYGTAGNEGAHGVYIQDWGDVIHFNIFEGSISDRATGCASMRISKGFFMNNICKTVGSYTPTGGSPIPLMMGVGPLGNTDLQDDEDYFNYNMAFGPDAFFSTGTCSSVFAQYPFCRHFGIGLSPQIPTGGMATYAAFAVEHFNSFFMLSNATQSNAGTGGGCINSISQNHEVYGYELPHHGYFFYNLNDCPNAVSGVGGQYWLETLRYQYGYNGDSYLPLDFPNATFQNNVYVWNSNASGNPSGTGRSDSHFIYRKNVVRTGQVDPSNTNIPVQYGGNANGVGGVYGLNQAYLLYGYVAMDPVNLRSTGWLSSNWTFTSTTPYNSTTLLPTSGSASIGAADPNLPYPVSLYQPMWQAVFPNMTLSRRTQLSTAGPYDAPGAPAPPRGLSGNGVFQGNGTNQ